MTKTQPEYIYSLNKIKLTINKIAVHSKTKHNFSSLYLGPIQVLYTVKFSKYFKYQTVDEFTYRV